MSSITGNIIESECRSRGMTLKDLSKISGVPNTTLHSWTTGRTPNLNQLQKVANALGLSLYKLAFGHEDPNSKGAQVNLTELFSGDLRVTIHKISKE